MYSRDYLSESALLTNSRFSTVKCQMQVQGNLQRTETLLGLKQEKCRAAVAQVEQDGHVCKVGRDRLLNA